MQYCQKEMRDFLTPLFGPPGSQVLGMYEASGFWDSVKEAADPPSSEQNKALLTLLSPLTQSVSLWAFFVACRWSLHLCQVRFLVSLCIFTIGLLSYFEIMGQTLTSGPNSPLDLFV